MGKKKRVAIDLHDTVVEYVTKCIRLYGWPKDPSNKLIREMWPNVDWDRHFDDESHWNFIEDLDALNGAVAGVRAFKRSKEYNPVFVTATSSDQASVKATKQMLKSAGFPRLPLYFTNGLENKAEWIIDNQDMIDVLIEDHGPTLMAALNHTAIRVIVMDTPWNRYVRAGTRVASWAEIFPLFDLPREG